MPFINENDFKTDFCKRFPFSKIPIEKANCVIFVPKDGSEYQFIKYREHHMRNMMKQNFVESMSNAITLKSLDRRWMREMCSPQNIESFSRRFEYCTLIVHEDFLNAE